MTPDQLDRWNWKQVATGNVAFACLAAAAGLALAWRILVGRSPVTDGAVVAAALVSVALLLARMVIRGRFHTGGVGIALALIVDAFWIIHAPHGSQLIDVAVFVLNVVIAAAVLIMKLDF
jgi:hypothetical protein